MRTKHFIKYTFFDKITFPRKFQKNTKITNYLKNGLEYIFLCFMFHVICYMKLLVTGGASFIGSNFIHYILKKYPEDQIVNLDALTYAGNLEI